MAGTRQYKMRCSQCYARDWRALHLGRIHARTWENVRLVRPAGQGGIFECGTCGHRWRSSSKAAFDLLDSARRKSAQPGG